MIDEVCEMAKDAARNVMGQAIMEMMEQGIPITHDALVTHIASMFGDEERSCVAELAMFILGVSKH